MKKSFLLLAILFASVKSYSQCNNFYSIKEGTLFELENYNAKDKKEGRILNKVTNYSESGNGFTATINSTVFDKKDKESVQGDYTISCNNGVVLIDMKKFIPEETLKSMGDAEIEITGDNLELPSNLAVGQTLKDGTVELKISSQQPIGSSTVISIKDRKVEAKETVATPAGSFDCYKISYNINSKINMMGININNSMRAEEWVSAGVGTVKTLSYNARGALIGYTVLSRFEK